ncbi:hypothetical protein ACHAPJ_011023 [Fusarium lateritium]
MTSPQPNHDDQPETNESTPSNLVRLVDRLIVSPSKEGWSFAVRNPNKDGPQTDIYARVPGRPNTWVARTSGTDCLLALSKILRGSLPPTTMLSFMMEPSETAYTVGPNNRGIPIQRSLNVILWTGAPDMNPTEQAKERVWPFVRTVLGEEGFQTFTSTTATQ